jgi:hypothetical protein
MSQLSIRQYSYLAVTSKTLRPQDIEGRLLMKADAHEQWGKGRLKADPTYRLTNVWKLLCVEIMRVDEQIEALITRISPAKERLLKLTSQGDVEVSLQIVRYFNDPHGESEAIVEDGEYIKLSGQHQLLGWSISAEALALLASLHANVDVDEYN